MPVRFKEAPTTFYLGRRFDAQTHKPTDEPVYYDSRDLTTHAVVVGMTGSGKTGLCISLLEEAVLDNIPAIIIDPKGDITNLLLQFPQLRPEDFRPWVNVDDARREHMEPDEYAEKVAQQWREGLADAGIVPGRMQALTNAAQFSIYTPGSDAGLPVSILDSLQAPREGWGGYEEAHRERISGTVTALLALVGKNSNPVKDREHVLISNIFEQAWKEARDLTLEQIILEVQDPPFAKLGVFDIDTFFPKKERFKLAAALNQIVAAPSFQSWMQGEPLDVRHLLYTEEGRPRVSIFYIAHLNDAERTFMITLLLENMLSWMRTQSGTTSLRALFYMDEVYGHFPPYPYNPPTKGPLIRLLKQARAFGLGIVLATQNPVDLDYKGLSNAGTWFIGKLQTDNDKRRILGGLEAAMTSPTQFDLHKLDNMLSGLDQRVFVVNNIHNPEGPQYMMTRWAMSYLRGPLTRQQVRVLMEPQRESLNMQNANQYTHGAEPVIAPPPTVHASGARRPVTPVQQPTFTPLATNPAANTPPAPNNPAAGLFSGRSSGNSGVFPRVVPSAAQAAQPNDVPESDQVGAPPSSMTAPPPVPFTGATPPPPGDPESGGFIPRSFGAGVAVKDAPPMPDLPLGLSNEGTEVLPKTKAPLPVAVSSSISAQPARGKPANVPEDYNDRPTSLAGNTAQYFLPMITSVTEAIRAWEQKFGTQALSVGDSVLLYRPMLLGQVVARYIDRKSNTQEDQLIAYQIPDLASSGFINWDQYSRLPLDPTLLTSDLPSNGWFGDIPEGLTDNKRLTAVRNEMIDHVYRTAKMTLLYNSTLDLYGEPRQTKRDYSIRLQAKAREERDAEIEKVTGKYDADLEKLDEKLRHEMRDHTADLRSLEDLRREETYTAGEAVFGLMRGRPSYTLSRMSRTRRYKGQAQERAFANEQQINDLEKQIESKQEELRGVLTEINTKWAKIASTIEETKLTPYKKDISVQLYGIGWTPAWSVTVNGQIVLLPAG